ncbi:MAG: lipid-A-disaccharide synthase, partial [Pseudomonadales bacterium]|nr:lipid-A-disaccharide synthase [Pseudomonadales bacterium]
MPCIVISAGEASGDLHAANMLAAMQQKQASLDVYAMGGDKLRSAGAEVVIDCSELAVIGLIEVLKNYRKIKAALEQMKQLVRDKRPDLVILVDYQEFNMQLAEYAKSIGIKTLFYIGPQVWAWRPHRVHKMRQRIDMMAVLFPFEVDFYTQAKVPVRFVGNPLVDEVQPSADKAALLSRFALDQKAANKQLVALFPGSRKSEIKRLLPTQIAAAKLIASQRSDVHFVLAVASTLDQAQIEASVSQLLAGAD